MRRMLFVKKSKRIAEKFPDAQHIPDYYHLSENVYTFAKCKFKLDENQYIPWAAALCIGTL